MIFKKRKNDDSKKIIIKDDKSIPYHKIKNLKNVTLVVITKDESVLKKVIASITDFHKEHSDMDINVVISSSYKKLHELSQGAL